MEEMDSFRTLYELALEYEGDALYSDVLEPSIPAAKTLMRRLDHFRELRRSPPGQAAMEDLWSLFALSVLNDYLVIPLRLSSREYRQFFSALGFDCFDQSGGFNPVLCEIVVLANWPDPEDGVTTGRQYWPGLRLGELVFSRCAVDVYCHPSYGLINGIADRSVLYFTYNRMRREADHPSHGWGSNSRWRSDFYRNYVTGGFAFLNVDGKYDLATAATGDKELDGITPEEAGDLLLHRSYVRFSEQPGRWPYYWRMAIENTDLPWPQSSGKVVPFQEALSLANVL